MALNHLYVHLNFMCPTWPISSVSPPSQKIFCDPEKLRSQRIEGKHHKTLLVVILWVI